MQDTRASYLYDSCRRAQSAHSMCLCPLVRCLRSIADSAVDSEALDETLWADSFGAVETRDWNASSKRARGRVLSSEKLQPPHPLRQNCKGAKLRAGRMELHPVFVTEVHCVLAWPPAGGAQWVGVIAERTCAMRETLST